MAGTKERILQAALELFSEEGYEAVGVDRIAAKVGIKGPSLYKHFKGKQQLFDSLLEETGRRYEEHSVFATLKWDEIPLEDVPSSVEEVTEMTLKQLNFILDNPMLRMTRRLLVIEQFRNERIKREEEKRSFQDVYNFSLGMIRRLVEKGLLVEGDLETMALQYMGPVSIVLYRVDRMPELKDEAMDMVRRHIQQYFLMYGRR